MKNFCSRLAVVVSITSLSALSNATVDHCPTCEPASIRSPAITDRCEGCEPVESIGPSAAENAAGISAERVSQIRQMLYSGFSYEMIINELSDQNVKDSKSIVPND